MNLTIRLQPQTAPTCFISLPTAIAASLHNLHPSANLTILTLHRQHRQPDDEIVLGWAGDSVQSPDTLGIHPKFASALGLRDSDLVQVVVSERVSAQPAVKVLSAVLRPVSYDDDDTPPQGVLGAYECLSGTADVLERSVLPQIRVLYKGLRFPITLPGRECVVVRVTDLKLSNGSSCKYGVLVPGSELIVEPPPMVDEQHQFVNCKLRVLSFADSLRDIEHDLLLTHAILPNQFASSRNNRAARVSKLPLRDRDFVLPLLFTCHTAIPENHVWLPKFIWQHLKLVPLDPVLIQQIQMFPPLSNNLRIDTNTITIHDPHLPTFQNIRDKSASIYNGMPLRNGTVAIVNVRETKNNSVPDVGENGDNEQGVLEIMAHWQGTDRLRTRLDEACRTLRAKMTVIPGWTIDETQDIKFEESDDFDKPSTGIAEDTTTHNPMLDDTLRTQLAESLTRLSRTAVHDAVTWAGQALYGNDGANKSNVSKMLLISGPEGSGKTLVCKTLATILRTVALLRTIWLQCTPNNEKSHVLVKRLQRAYDAAADCGPGVVILDDVDFWIGARRNENVETPEEPGGRGMSDHGYELLRRMRMIRSHSVLSIMTCRNAMDLDDCCRAPGAIDRRLNLELPGREDMTILRWAASQEMNNVSDYGPGSPPSHSASAMEAVTPSLEGYNAKEIQLLFSRAFNQIEPESTLPQDKQVVRHLEKMISEMAPGGMNKGSRSRKNEANWTWNKIGGAETAKKALTEVLLWPSRRHELFQGAPLSLPRGVLLYGPPGCGKTMLAKAAANESKMRCIVVKGPELMSKYIGESEAEVRRAFVRASRLRPCVLLFDEFDSLAPRRGSGTGVTDRIVNTLLTCMDGAERLSEGVYLLATSSRPELIDPAVLRPGRIDRWVPVEVPASVDERLDILRRLSQDFFNSSELLDDALQNIAHVTEDYTGADLGAILNDGRIKIRKMGRGKKLSENEVVEAIGEALKESHPSISHSERARFRQVMESFGRSPGKGGRAIPSHQRVALK